MQDTVRLTLDDAIAIAQEQSVNAAMAKNKQKTAYWQYRTFRAEQLPEITFTGDLPDYRRRERPCARIQRYAATQRCLWTSTKSEFRLPLKGSE